MSPFDHSANSTVVRFLYTHTAFVVASLLPHFSLLCSLLFFFLISGKFGAIIAHQMDRKSINCSILLRQFRQLNGAPQTHTARSAGELTVRVCVGQLLLYAIVRIVVVWQWHPARTQILAGSCQREKRTHTRRRCWPSCAKLVGHFENCKAYGKVFIAANPLCTSFSLSFSLSLSSHLQSVATSRAFYYV